MPNFSPVLLMNMKVMIVSRSIKYIGLLDNTCITTDQQLLGLSGIDAVPLDYAQRPALGDECCSDAGLQRIIASYRVNDSYELDASKNPPRISGGMIHLR